MRYWSAAAEIDQKGNPCPQYSGGLQAVVAAVAF